MVRAFAYCWIVMCVALMGTGSAAAQGSPQALVARVLDGPPAPIAPAVVSRDAAGRATLRATRVEAPLRIDGALDEPLYTNVQAITGFTQIEPVPGAAATERTELWIAFDDVNVYWAVRCWDAQIERLVATEMRRDNNAIFSGNDVIAIALDTFYDRRNAFAFNVNPAGGRQDGQIANNRQFSADFNPIWEVKSGRFDGGWTLEAAIPFKSLRYSPGRTQVWGVNLMRAQPSRNEIAFITPMPPGRGRAGMTQVSLAATLVGIEAPPQARNFEVKPFATSSLTSDVNARPTLSNEPDAAVGLDVKYALTQGLTLDATVNTDFAQVEADEQQVNLTRFSLFFPEKRDFFLENQGAFAFGGIGSVGANAGSGDSPILFYSRRIGLNQNRLVPLRVGGRLTGRVGKYTVGAVDIQTGEESASRTPSTNFSVVRVKRDILRRSAIGVIATGRSVGQFGTGTNQAFGVDGTFTFYTNVNINTYWARTVTDGRGGNDRSYRAQFDYPGDRYGVQVERLDIGKNFNPEIGFVRRPDIRRSFGQFRFSPRLKSGRLLSRHVRKFSYTASITHIENGEARLESRERMAEFAIEFVNADRFQVSVNNEFEFLPAPFRIATGVVLPVGGYDFNNVEVGFNMGTQRRRAANLLFEHGQFYNGHRTAFTASRGRLQVSNQLSVEPTYSLNHVSLMQGGFTSHLGGARVTYTMTPLMFASALIQYNSSTSSVSANARLRWEYRPGSELFVVYNEQRDTRLAGFPGLTNRALILKINRLLRF
jgi:hypothetical protein